MKQVSLTCLKCNATWKLFGRGGWLRCPQCGNEDIIDQIDRPRSIIQVGRYTPEEVAQLQKHRKRRLM